MPTSGSGNSGSGNMAVGGFGACCGCTNFTVDVFWCIATDVPPGTITVTVQQNNSSGAVVATGTASAAGQFKCEIPSSGTYYFSASTTASGYLMLPETHFISLSGSAPSPSSAIVRIYPDQLTLTDPIAGSITLLPSGSLSWAGSGSYQNYIGSSTYNYGAACSCAAGSVTLQYSVETCDTANITLSVYCPQNYPTDPLACPDTSGSNAQGGGSNFSGTGPQQSTCYPVNMSATATFPGGTGGWATVYDICTGGSESYTLTQ